MNYFRLSRCLHYPSWQRDGWPFGDLQNKVSLDSLLTGNAFLRAVAGTNVDGLGSIGSEGGISLKSGWNV
jgi:hypothetical protein